ncbi:hypothetical protein KFL_000310160 [Klebsormidium nitens]|uniref:Uncharacterized protein n=1 Tax=Klebsormidium nitens TaxID=105231 RepID=A0A1Y1HLH3_KLENI|nr:hypothetical protein KFL_000310160 [Klebsormidium nitens]|eukprot:GAQ79465.1 hypothetical protein KFL_000310160 [Klebsormidium nitens]
MEPAWHWEETLQYPPDLTLLPDLLWTEGPQSCSDEPTFLSQGTCDETDLFIQSQESQGYVVSTSPEPLSPSMRACRKRKLIGEEHRQAERVSLSGCASDFLEPSTILSTESWSQDHGVDCTAGSSYAVLRGEEAELLDGVESIFVPVKDINPSYTCEEATVESIEPSPPGPDHFLRATKRQQMQDAGKPQRGQRFTIGKGIKQEQNPLSSPPRAGTAVPSLASPLSPLPIQPSKYPTQLFTPPRNLERRVSGGSKIYPFGPPRQELGASPTRSDVSQGLRSPPTPAQKVAHSPAVSSSSPRTRSLGGRTVIKLTKIKTEGTGSITVLKTK